MAVFPASVEASCPTTWTNSVPLLGLDNLSSQTNLKLDHRKKSVPLDHRARGELTVRVFDLVAGAAALAVVDDRLCHEVVKVRHPENVKKSPLPIYQSSVAIELYRAMVRTQEIRLRDLGSFWIRFLAQLHSLILPSTF